MQPGDTRWRVACKPGYYSDESAFIMLSSNSFKYDPEVADAQVSPGLEHPLAGSLEREISLPSLVVVGSARLTRHDWFQVTSLVIALPLDLHLACGRHVFPLRCRTLLREDRFGSRVAPSLRGSSTPSSTVTLRSANLNANLYSTLWETEVNRLKTEVPVGALQEHAIV